MAPRYAFATLITSDHYLPGALALAGALKDVHHLSAEESIPYQTVCIVTPETVDVNTIKHLRRTYDVVIGVEVIEQLNDANLRLLGRLDLFAVLTKLHVFRLTQYEKIIFLDADVLPVRPLSHLFTLPHEFSAVPDIGWPDIFNSGVMVLTPGEDKFKDIMDLVKTKGSWDGGDQGVLNEWRGGDWNRLSFTYNTTPTGSYMFAPAYERFGSQISAIHFIGPNKPWTQIPYRAPGSKSQEASAPRPSSSSTDAGGEASASSSSLEPQRIYGHGSFVDRWFDVYDRYYRQPAKPAAEQEFEVRRYESAWNDAPPPKAQNFAAEAFASSSPSFSVVSKTTGGALGLDDLRRLALEGGTGSVASQAGEGEYHSLPLEGRIDLMRPKIEVPPELVVELEDFSGAAEGKQERGRDAPGGEDEGRARWQQQFGDQGAYPGTPEPKDVPPSPHLTPLPLPYALPPSPFPGPHGGLGESQSYFEQKGGQGGAGDQYHYQHQQPPPPSGGGQGHGQQSQQGHGENQNQQWQGEQQHRDQHHDGQSYQEQSHQQQQQNQQQQYFHEPPPRPPSPPKINWNPAVEPPPNNPPPATSSFQTNQYYTNVWDIPATSAKLHNALTGSEDSNAFFQAPAPSQIPQHLIREGHYSNVMGHSDHHASKESHHRPDINKVTSVFPWEQKPRHMPGRVFPEGEKAPGAKYIEDMPPEPEPEPEPVPETPEPTPPPPKVESPPPPAPYQGSRSFSNAWDSIPSIQRYASRLSKPSLLFSSQHPPAALPRSSRRRSDSYRSRGEQSDANSMDGDVEDEMDDDEDDDDDEKDNSGRLSGSERSGKGSRASSSKRDKNGSTLPPYRLKTGSGKKEYRSFGVQTLPKDVRSVGVQTAQHASSLYPTGNTKNVDEHGAGGGSSAGVGAGGRSSSGMSQKKAGKMRQRTSSSGTSGTSISSIGSHLELGKPATAQELNLKFQQEQLASVTPGLASIQSFIRPATSRQYSGMGAAGGALSPRMNEFGYNGGGQQQISPNRTPTHNSPAQTGNNTPSGGATGSLKPMLQNIRTSASAPFPLSNPPSLITRASSSSTTDSVGPLSPMDAMQQSPSMRKGRSWNPATGVDVFKRGSEEVLAKFLRMGSWEEESPGGHGLRA